MDNLKKNFATLEVGNCYITKTGRVVYILVKDEKIDGIVAPFLDSSGQIYSTTGSRAGEGNDLVYCLGPIPFYGVITEEMVTEMRKAYFRYDGDWRAALEKAVLIGKDTQVFVINGKKYKNNRGQLSAVE
jgi:hypothetical protein